MVRTCLVLVLVLGLVLCSPVSAKGKKAPEAKANPVKAAAMVGQEIAAFSRLVSFDPHSTTLDFPAPLTVGGKTLRGTIELAETWGKGDSPALKEIGIKARFTEDDGTEFARLEIPPVKLDSKACQAGALLGEKTDQGLGLRVRTETAVRKSGGAGEIVLAFAVLSVDAGATARAVPVVPTAPDAPAVPVATSTPVVEGAGAKPVSPPADLVASASVTAAPSTAEIAAAGAVGLSLAQQLFLKAEALQATPAAKALMMQRALKAIPAGLDSPEATALRAQIEARLTESGTPAPAPAVPGSEAAPPAPAAASVVQESKARDPEAVEWFQQATRLFAEQKEPEARDLLRKAVQKDPRFYDAWVLMGKNAMQNSKYARAREAYEAALGLRPNDADSAMAFFKASYYLGESEKGIEKIQAVVNRFPDDFAPRMNLAEAYFQAGDLPSCEQECQALMGRFPQNDRCANLLVRCRERMK